MFRKHLNDLKTSAPLRSSDRKKLRLRVLNLFALSDSPHLGDLLVPEGIQSIKFSASNAQPAIAYLSPDGDALWFSLGKLASDSDLLPTVYTLWNYPQLLPSLSTPSAVIPILYNGADLMIAGVVEHTPNLKPDQLVSVRCYYRDARGPSLAVGRIADGVNDSVLQKDGAKGKAVIILHTHRDKLWELGRRTEPPEPEKAEAGADASVENDGSEVEGTAETVPLEESMEKADLNDSEHAHDDEEDHQEETLTPEEVSALLTTSLIQAIRTTLGSLPPSTFPIPGSTLYSAYILPSRPSGPSTSTSTTIDIKHSSYKNLSAFLRAAEKDGGLLRLKKSTPAGGGGGGGGEVQVLGVAPLTHPRVVAHKVYRTLGEEQARKEKRAEREAGEAMKVREVEVTELWKPHLMSVGVFEAFGKDKSALYTAQDVRTAVNAYIVARNLVNPHQQAFVNIKDDTALSGLFASSGSSAGGGKASGAGARGETPEFVKRDALVTQVIAKMQPWHRVEVDGREPYTKKGKLEPVQVTTKVRQGGRKACTLLTGYEPFGLDSGGLAEALRVRCAGATSVSALPGGSGGGHGSGGSGSAGGSKSGGAGAGGGREEVMVQGKQVQAVLELLKERGVPKRWVVVDDLTTGGGKKK